MVRTLMLGAMLALISAPVFAQETGAIKVGDDMADFTAPNWMNAPSFASLNELKGDVIVLKAWGIN